MGSLSEFRTGWKEAWYLFDAGACREQRSGAKISGISIGYRKALFPSLGAARCTVVLHKVLINSFKFWIIGRKFLKLELIISSFKMNIVVPVTRSRFFLLADCSKVPGCALFKISHTTHTKNCAVSYTEGCCRGEAVIFTRFAYQVMERKAGM